MMDLEEKKKRACAASKRWRENNREKYLASNRANIRRQFAKHPLYWIWSGMMKRCGHRGKCDEKIFKNYAWRGIKVCDEWQSDWKLFESWALANGWKKGLEIDRIDNDGNYYPENCRFVTRKENCNNRRTTVRVRGVTLLDFYNAYANKTLISLVAFKQRVRRGWPVEKALYEPFDDQHQRVTLKSVPLTEFYEAYANKDIISYSRFLSRIRRGWSVEKALYTAPRAYRRSA